MTSKLFIQLKGQPERRLHGAAVKTAYKKSRGAPLCWRPAEGEAGGALLSRAPGRSIIAAGALNGRVRDGNGCSGPAKATSQKVSGTHAYMRMLQRGTRPGRARGLLLSLSRPARDARGGGGQAPRPIRTPRLSASPRLRLAPVYQVVFLGPSGACARDGLSGGAWRLDAFSAYPFGAWLPGRADRLDNRCTRGAPPPVLSYWGALPSAVLRLRRIRTELSHDVLNPARVTL